MSTEINTEIRELTAQELDLASGAEVSLGPVFAGTFDNGFYFGIAGVGVLWVGHQVCGSFGGLGGCL